MSPEYLAVLAQDERCILNERRCILLDLWDNYNMHKTYQYRLYPTKVQLKYLQASLDACRWVYNKTLEVRKETWEKERKTLSLYDTINLLTTWKREDPLFLKIPYSQCLLDAQVRVDLAFSAFFRRVKAKEKPGFPRFKSFTHYDSFTYPQFGFRIEKNLLIVSKIGTIKIKLHRKPKGKIKTLTLKRTFTGKWFASFSCDVEPKHLKKSKDSVGIDVGLHSFAYLSNGESIAAPKFFRSGEKALAKVQRRFSKEVKGSAERRYRRKAVARAHERIVNRRKNFTHQLSRQIINRFGIICVEDLNINRMVRDNRFSKSISDAAWSQFFQQLVYKAEDAGRVLVKVNPAYTSQTCSSCGNRQKMPLSDREFVCECGFKGNRDHNAALNIKALGMQSLANA